MRCIRCGHDSKHKDRSNRTCPQCRGKFAFEPQAGDPVTDQLFKNAIGAVSSGGNIRWGVEHLYYEVNRRKRRRRYPLYVTLSVMLAGLFFIYYFLSTIGMHNPGFPRLPLGFPLGLPIGAALIFVAARSLTASPFVAIDAVRFRNLWDRWCQVHGTPDGVIQRSPEIEARHRAARSASVPGGRAEFGKRQVEPALAGVGGSVPSFGRRGSEPPPESDLADYSFDRAVICDRARTADLLIANNFHFENNCAILSIDGYPENVFETVRAMLKRNPRLHVFTLHDAAPDGCRLANRIAFAPDWFAGKTLVVDLGLRPRHASQFHGLLQPSLAGRIVDGQGIDAKEADWLSKHTLELAAVRPEDVLKRLFRGIQAHDKDDTSAGGTTTCSSFDSHGSGDSTDGGDSFG